MIDYLLLCVDFRREISDAYNRDEQHPENFLDSDDVAKLTMKQVSAPSF